MNTKLVLIALTLLVHLQWSGEIAHSGEHTLRSLGATGDGKTDDRAAIEAALIKAAGAPVDGEGATYAVHGDIEVHNDVNLRNATLVQTMTPVDISAFIPSATGKGEIAVVPPEALRGKVGTLPVLHADGIATYSDDVVLSDEQIKAILPSMRLNTLAITGEEGKPVSARLEKIKIIRGNHAACGDDDSAGVLLAYAGPVFMSDIEVTGDGKGTGVSIRHCTDVRLERLNIHDMNWAPYVGDNVFEVASAKSIKEDFGWNNFPLYALRADRKQFVRVRVREQIAGLFVQYADNVQLIDSRFANFQTRIGEDDYPLQADGVTMASVTNALVSNCHFSNVWEGIDITGELCDDLVCKDCTATDTLTFGFKLAHPKSNVKMIRCKSYKAGNTGFVMESEVENIEFIDCHALETGGSGYWTRDNGERLMTTRGFGLATNHEQPTPRHVKFKNCTAINREFPGAMDFGFCCEAGIDPAEREIIAVKCAAEGARVKGIEWMIAD
jgi:hypothetical protein